MKKYILKWILLILIGEGFISSTFSQDSLKEKARDHYRLGQIYYEHGLYKEAEEEYRKALDILGNFPKGESLIKETKKKSQPLPSKREEKVSSPQKEYIIGIGDVLSITVWENPDLNQEVIVRPDGMISFPLIDEVKAAGLTLSELDKVITERLKQYIRYPDVSISLRSMGGNRIIVLGEVNSPGVYTISGRRTVLEAVALAGGFTNDAVLNSIVVIRGGLKNPYAERIDLSRVLRGKNANDIPLNAQDIVYVPKKFIANLNYFLKQILEPISRGMYTVKQFDTW